MQLKEIEAIFATNSEGKYINLIIPASGDFPEMNLTGKTKLELSLDEIVRLKKYAGELFSSITD